MLFLRLVRLARRVRARRYVGLGIVVFLLAIAILGNAITFYTFERSQDPTIGWGDAIWYSIISITTVGYGDFAPKSAGARMGTVVFIILLGITSFSLFFGMTIDWLTLMISNAKKGLGRAVARDHILVVHFPSAQRVRQIIEEIRSDPEQGEGEIVIISDAIEELPFSMRDVIFVRGSSHDIETYKRAAAEDCRMAIVLSPDYGSSTSDAIVAAAVSVIDDVKSDIHIVAECLEDKHRPLFDAVNCDAVVLGMTIAGNLLVQEVHDPGIAQLIEVVTSNRLGVRLFSVDVKEAGVPYTELAKNLLDHGINVLAVNRKDATMTVLSEVESTPFDQIIYSAGARLDWTTLRARAGV